MTKHLAMEYILIWMVPSMKANGKKTFNMEKVTKYGKMVLSTMVCMIMAKNMDLELISGKINPAIEVIGPKII